MATETLLFPSTEKDGARIERRQYNAQTGHYDLYHTTSTNDSFLSAFLERSEKTDEREHSWQYRLINSSGETVATRHHLNGFLIDVVAATLDQQYLTSINNHGS